MIVALAHTNPAIALTGIIGRAQTLLDRVRFIAFAEDRTLLPEKTLDRAYCTHNEFNPQPIWENFHGLTRKK